MSERKIGFDTLQVHGGHVPDKETLSRAVPIYQTTSYVFKDTKHAADLFALKEFGNIYTRIMNPTSDVFEKRMALLDGGSGALAVSSGSAAITLTIMNLASAGDHIVAASTLYGGTYNLFSVTLPRYGINTTFVDPDDVTNFENELKDNSKALYVGTIGNPNANIADLEGISKIAKKYGIPLVVDNTFATPYLCKPIEYGADVVVYSATKFLGGHGTSIGGIIVDSGNFKYKNNKRFPQFNTPDRSYHGVTYSDLNEIAFIIKARVQLLRDMGPSISPFNSFLFLMGLETLSLRMDKHVANAEKIADFLNNHDQVNWVNYPNLNGNKYKPLKDKYLKKGAGSIFTFGIKGGFDSAVKFIESLEIFSHLANVADAKSLVIHPASTTHSQLSESELQDSGIGSDLIRLSIGIEDVDDLIYDLNNALNKSREV